MLTTTILKHNTYRHHMSEIKEIDSCGRGRENETIDAPQSQLKILTSEPQKASGRLRLFSSTDSTYSTQRYCYLQRYPLLHSNLIIMKGRESDLLIQVYVALLHTIIQCNIQVHKSELQPVIATLFDQNECLKYKNYKKV